MFIKLAIICSVLLVTVIVFQDEIYQLFPETSSSIIDVTTNDFDKIKDDAIEKTGTTITAGGKLINNQVQDFAKDSTEKISESINDFSESAQQVVTLGIFGNDKNENNIIIWLLARFKRQCFKGLNCFTFCCYSSKRGFCC